MSDTPASNDNHAKQPPKFGIQSNLPPAFQAAAHAGSHGAEADLPLNNDGEVELAAPRPEQIKEPAHVEPKPKSVPLPEPPVLQKAKPVTEEPVAKAAHQAKPAPAPAAFSRPTPVDHKVTLDDLVSLAKRRGFIYQGSEIYGGLAGTWDYGPLGVTLKRNIEQLWWKMFVDDREDMYGLDTAILMNPKVWQASGHTGAGFADPLVEDLKTGKRYRADHLLEDNGVENPEAMTYEQMNQVIAERGITSPDGNRLSEVRVFNMMFETYVGPVHDEKAKSYLRPETAQGMFVNFRNIMDSFYPDLPFGIAQAGRNFRNEISPREFIFRVRELEIMELEYFIEERDWEKHFEHWRQQFYAYIKELGLKAEKLHELDVPDEDRAHYSKKTIDFEYEFPFGIKEIGAVAYRTDFDLRNHQEHSGVNMEYLVKSTHDRFIPHVIEPTFGLTRLVLATIAEAYSVDEHKGEKRIFLRLPEHLAPVRYCVSPLLKNKPELVERAREVYRKLKKRYGNVMWDDNGNIGKRYRRQDEIGTPHCVVIDFQTLEDGTVTVRDRDTTEQKRVNADELTK